MSERGSGCDMCVCVCDMLCVCVCGKLCACECVWYGACMFYVYSDSTSTTLLLCRGINSLIQKLSLIPMKYQSLNRSKTLGILVRRKVGAKCFGNVEKCKPV